MDFAKHPKTFKIIIFPLQNINHKSAVKFLFVRYCKTHA